MKKISLSLLLSLLVLTTNNATYALNVEGFFAEETKDILQIGVVPEKQKQLKALLEEQETLLEDNEIFTAKISNLLEQNKNHIAATKKDLAVYPDDEYLKQKESILIDLDETLSELSRARELRLAKLDEQISLLQSFLADKDFTEYRRDRKLLTEKPRYSFRDLERAYDMLLEQERHIAQLTEQEKNTATTIEGHKKTEASLADEQKKRTHEIKTLSNPTEADYNGGVITDRKATDLQQLLETLFEYKNQLKLIHNKAISYQTSFLRFKSYIEHEKLQIIKNHLSVIKSRISVTENEILESQEAVTLQKRESSAVKDDIRRQRNDVSEKQKQAKEKLDSASKQYNIPLGTAINEWTRDPEQTVDSFSGTCDIGASNSLLLLLQQKQLLLDAQVNLEDEKLQKTTIQVEIKESYRNIKQLVLDDAIAPEIQRYEKQRSEILSKLTRHKELISSTAELITSQKRILGNIKEFRSKLSQVKSTVFSQNNTLYTQCNKQIDRAQKNVQEQVEVLGQLASSHSEIAATLNRTQRSLDFIIAELQANSLWHRPEEAISWEGFKNAPADIMQFFTDLRTYITHFDITYLGKRIFAPLRAPWVLFALLFKLLLLILAILSFWQFAPIAINYLTQLGTQYTGIWRTLCILANALLTFVHTYLTGIALFTSLFALLVFYQTQDRYIYILYCLALIPYLIHLTRRFIAFLIEINTRNEYIFLTEEYQRRFSFVLSFLISSTIILVLFRTAFILANYPQSEVPTILWALNFIIGQISLIMLIFKEQVLFLIPTRGDLWQWIRNQVDRYYYLFLICFITVIILSHPHIGFWQLVRNILDRVIKTGLLLVLLLWLHGVLKRTSSRIFFATSDEVVRERFTSAKTWFGLLIIVSFISLAFFGFLVTATIWGWQITFDDVETLLKTPLFGKGTDNPFSAIEFIQIIGFLSLGLILSYSLNHFVFAKIFDLLLVDAGIQHTVTSIAQYLVVILVLYIGLNKVIGTGINYLVALAFGIGYILKEPAADFFAYFIILVQRPIKLGDYIKIDDEVRGVVRKITARAVILRRKNSTMIVVSNAYLLSKALINWNYTRNFIAFSDIKIVVDYREDPTRVKELLQEAIESHPNVLRNPKPVIRLDEFSEYGYTFMIRGFLSSVYTLEQWNIASDVRLGIVSKLRESNVKIAVPVRMIIGPNGNNKAHTTDDITEQ